MPGGAIDDGEPPLQAAARELAEEVTGLDASQATVTGTLRAPCPAGCGWAYTTVIMRLPASGALPRVRVARDAHNAWETSAVRWFPAERVASLRLHPAFAAAWPELRERIGEVSRARP